MMKRAPTTVQNLKTGATVFGGLFAAGVLRCWPPSLDDWCLYVAALRGARGVQGKSAEKYLGHARLMISDIIADTFGVSFHPEIFIPRAIRHTIKGFVHCDAPRDKIPKMTVGWPEYRAIRGVVSIAEPFMRLYLLKTAVAIGHLMRVTEHNPRKKHAPRNEPGRLEYCCFQVIPNLLNPRILVHDAWLSKTNRVGARG